ncbi:MAG: uridine kinase [Candidatus Thermofonsia Clade 1 bacterium]|uniref:Uridine kinase n=1 Tax=Candidatus Thermofonsia Clade 1 bacterium TaxID=2364210 RepID=A0A2M8PH62_9CHLR|nr:MAG: uridine kinase [Candidatus Thermofonsia Clade 1 bacterium]
MNSESAASEQRRAVVIGVAGGSGSGKTTVAQRLLHNIGEAQITYLPHDAYYRDLDAIPRIGGEIVNFDHPEALETSLLIQHLAQLRRGQPVQAPIYDFSTHSRSPQTRTIYPAPIILVEGILIFADPELRAQFDLRLFVDADADIRFIRRLERDVNERGRTVESVVHQYLASVRPMHLEFVEPSKRYADVIIPEGGYNDVAIDLVSDHIKRLLESIRAQPA